MGFRAPAVGLLALLAVSSLLAAGEPTAPYLDPSRSVEERVGDLVSRMTLQERAAQLQDQAPAIPRLGIPA